MRHLFSVRCSVCRTVWVWRKERNRYLASVFDQLLEGGAEPLGDDNERAQADIACRIFQSPDDIGADIAACCQLTQGQPSTGSQLRHTASDSDQFVGHLGALAGADTGRLLTHESSFRRSHTLYSELQAQPRMSDSEVHVFPADTADSAGRSDVEQVGEARRPLDVIRDRADGALSTPAMLVELAQFTYTSVHPAASDWDSVAATVAVGTIDDLGRAYDEGLLTAPEYDALVRSNLNVTYSRLEA